MIDIKKVISILLVICTLFSALPIAALALSWDGSSAGGSTNAVNGSSTGYVIRSTIDSNCVVGYRFSAVTSTGTMKVTKVIDVYRNTTNGNNAYTTSAKFSTKYNKKQVIANKNATVTFYAQWRYVPELKVKECYVYDGAKGAQNKLYGIATGTTFDDYLYRTDYPTIGNTIWLNVNFLPEVKNTRVRQYVKFVGGDWVTRDVTLSSSDTSSQWFPVQFTGKYKTLTEDLSCITIYARQNWIDENGNVLRTGAQKTLYIPIKPVVYRTQVKATGYDGSVVAYNGTGGSSGKLYSGQHIRTAYRYTADNTWGALEYLRGSMYAYKDGTWTTVYGENDGFDAVKNKVTIMKSQPVTVNSAIEAYTVPVTSQNRLRFKLETWWASDKTHTMQSTWLDLPVVKSDIALSKIVLVDASTKAVLDPNNLEAGQNVLVRYEYKNNTDTKVFVEGYKNDKSKISGVYAIPANSSVTVDGYTFTVPNKRSIDIWGGVYLEGLGIYNTEYETNGENNAKTLTCKVKHPLTLQPIAQKADYRENTEVITSFWVKNNYSDDYSNVNSDIKVRFKVYNGSNVIATYTRNYVVVPGNEYNLVHFKWKVPTGLHSSKVKIVGEIIDGGVAHKAICGRRQV